MDEHEQQFLGALAEQHDWLLVDEGILETVLECATCDHRERFQTRDDATYFLVCRERCPQCDYEEAMSHIG